MNTERILNKYSEDPLAVLRELGGYYECPKDAQGKRLGPLVGYAGKDKKGRQFVGDIYANFAEMEQWPRILEHFASRIAMPEESDVFCGAPLGGMTFGAIMACLGEARYVFPEKKVIAVATSDSREESELVFSRHKINSGERVVIVEDVTNNFSTTDKLIELVQNAGGKVIAITCLLNRSLTIDALYPSVIAGEIPIVSLARKPIQQWEHDDPAVAEDVAKGNVVWKPKNEWDRLTVAMAANP